MPNNYRVSSSIPAVMGLTDCFSGLSVRERMNVNLL